MPAYIAKLQKAFILTLVEGLPQADVDKIGEAHVIRCCPLCGCTHQILDMNEQLPYTPTCQTFPYIYKAQQTAWRKLYPDVAQFVNLHLTVLTGE